MGISDKARSQMEWHKTVGKQYAIRYRFPFAAQFQWERNRFIMDLLQGSEEMLVLDLGCGTGVMLDALAARFHNIVGLDLSMEMMAGIKANPDASIHLVQGDMEAIPFGDASFDRVVCRSILHHTTFEEKTLKDVFRILKPGGRLVIAEPMNDNPLFRFIRNRLSKGKSFGKIHTIDRAFMTQELRSLILSAGFEITREMRYGFVAYPLCDNPDLIPVLKYCPWAEGVAGILRGLDRFLARIPGIKMLSWYGITSAVRPQI